MINESIGVVCFDDEATATDAWCSIAGKDPFRIESLSELRSDIIWVSNLSYYDYRKLNLTLLPNVFDHQFFRLSLKQLAIENNLANNNFELTRFASLIFTRVALLGEENFKIKSFDVDYRYYTTLASAVIPFYARKKPTENFSFELMEAFKQATQENQAMTGLQAPKGSKAYPFYFPRTSYAQWLLSLDYPIGESWQELKESDYTGILGTENGIFIKGTVSKLKKLNTLNEKYAGFFRVTVINTEPEYREFGTFSAGSNHPRKWASIPEIIHLASIGKIKIEGGYITQKGKLSILKKLNFSDIEKELDYSYSLGLFLENLWIALSSPTNKKYYTALGAYIRSYDRIACFSMAEKFNQINFVTGSFGTGKVIVYAKKHEIPLLKDFSIEQNLLPPISFIEKK